MEAPKWFKQNMDIKSEAMSVMMTNTATLEEQMKQLQRRLAEVEAGALLLQAEKEVQAKRRADAEAKAAEQLAEKDTEIAELVAKFALLTKEKEKKKEADEEPKKTHSNSVSLQDIKTMIADGIKELQLSLNPLVSGYLKPYPSHYDALPFPKGYLKPTFDKFDGVNSSPHEHLAHFYSACGEASQVDELLVRQFVQSLKGEAFTWYTKLQPNSILTWDDLQKAFLAQFVTSRKRVSIIDLVDTKQKDDEEANAFISRWRSLHVQCSDKLTEQSAVQICSNNLLPEIAAFVSTAEPQTFDELVSKASNVERHVARKKIPIEMLFKSERVDSTGDSLATFVKTSETSNTCDRDDMSRELTLRERKKVKYSFADEDVEEFSVCSTKKMSFNFLS